MIFDIKLYLNGVLIPNDLIINISGLKSARIPDIGGCSFSLVNKQKVFWFNDEYVRETVYSDLNKKLSERIMKRNFTKPLRNIPMIYDNDSVWIFIKLNNSWYWLFFGYVDGYSESFGVDGEDVITVHCSNSLKLLSLSRTVFHEILIPYDIDVEEIEQWITFNYTPLESFIQGKDFFGKIRTILKGDFDIVVRTNSESEEQKVNSLIQNFKNTPKFFGNEDTYEVSLDEEVIIIFDFIQSWFSKIDNTILVGSDNDLNNLVEKLNNELERTGFVSRTFHLLELTSEKNNNMWFILTGSILSGKFSISNIVGKKMLDLLKSIFDNVLYTGYVLPNGDLVIEPLWFGLFQESFVKDRTIKADDCLKLDLAYSGNNIVTVIRTLHGIPNVMQTPEQRLLSNIPARGLVLGDALKKYGYRDIPNIAWHMGVLSNQSQLDALNRLEMLRNWYQVRSCNIIKFFDKFIWINRPVYVDYLEGYFTCESVDVSFNTDVKFATVSLVLKGGRFKGLDGEKYYTDLTDSDREKLCKESDSTLNVISFYKTIFE